MTTNEKQSNEKFCQECGKRINIKAEICPHCGVRQHLPEQIVQPNRVVAILFALFLGGIGIHKFYLGKTIQGLLYLLFSWTFIPLVISFIELIFYCFMSDETFAQTFNKVPTKQYTPYDN